MSKTAIINYAKGYDSENNLEKGLLVTIDNEEDSFYPSDDLKYAMKRFKKIQDKGYKLVFSEKISTVNLDNFLLLKKEYRD